LQAAAIILPIVLAQDALTVWTYRRDWSAWNLRIMIPSMAAGIAVAGLFAASLTAAHIRLAIGLIAGIFVLRHLLGARFGRRTPTELFFRIAYVLMFLISIELIRSGLIEMLRA